MVNFIFYQLQFFILFIYFISYEITKSLKKEINQSCDILQWIEHKVNTKCGTNDIYSFETYRIKYRFVLIVPEIFHVF
jgi:hypothetical protein